MKKKKKQIQKTPPEPAIKTYFKSGFKYGYILALFILLSGFFHPLITGTSGENVVIGTLVLAMGLFGAIMTYQALTTNSKPVLLAGIGLGIMAVTLYVILAISGRI